MATGLLDIALKFETVAGVNVTGISARGVSYLLARFPEVRKMMTGQELRLSVEELMTLAPDAVSAIIAAGCGYVPDLSEGSMERQKEAETKAGDLPVELQADFIAAILRVTMPGGVGPFVAKLEKLGAFAAEGFGQVAATKLPQP